MAQAGAVFSIVSGGGHFCFIRGSHVHIFSEISLPDEKESENVFNLIKNRVYDIVKQCSERFEENLYEELSKDLRNRFAMDMIFCVVKCLGRLYDNKELFQSEWQCFYWLDNVEDLLSRVDDVEFVYLAKTELEIGEDWIVFVCDREQYAEDGIEIIHLERFYEFVQDLLERNGNKYIFDRSLYKLCDDIYKEHILAHPLDTLKELLDAQNKHVLPKNQKSAFPIGIEVRYEEDGGHLMRSHLIVSPDGLLEAIRSKIGFNNLTK